MSMIRRSRWLAFCLCYTISWLAITCVVFAQQSDSIPLPAPLLPDDQLRAELTSVQERVVDLLKIAVKSPRSEDTARMLMLLDDQNGKDYMSWLERQKVEITDDTKRDELDKAIRRIGESEQSVTELQAARRYCSTLLGPQFVDFSEIQDCPNLRILEIPPRQNLNGDLIYLRGLSRLECLLLPSGFNRVGLDSVRKLPSLQKLVLSESSLTDSDLERFDSMSELRFLDLSLCNRLKGRGLEYIAGLPRLEFLSLPSSIEPRYLPKLNRCSSLKFLVLHKLEDAEEILKLEQVPNLQQVIIRDAAFTADDFAPVQRKLASIKVIAEGVEVEVLGKPPSKEYAQKYTDAEVYEDLAELRKLGHIVTFSQCGYVESVEAGKFDWGPGFTDAGMERLRSFGRLESLCIKGSKVTDAGLAQVSHMSFLKTLLLPSAITDRGIEKLGHLRSLERLGASTSQITDQGTERIAAQFPRLQLVSLPPTVTGQSIASLARLKNLESIYFQGSQIAVDDLEPLRDLPVLRSLSFTDIGFSDSEKKQIVTQFPLVEVKFQ